MLTKVFLVLYFLGSHVLYFFSILGNIVLPDIYKDFENVSYFY